MVVRQSRKSATAIFNGFESDCSVDFVYSSEDDLSDAEDDPNNQGQQNNYNSNNSISNNNNQHHPLNNMPNGYTRKSKLNDDVIETPMSQQNGGGDLYSSPYSSSNGRSIDDYFDEEERDGADDFYGNNRVAENGDVGKSNNEKEEGAKSKKERSLEKRVTDLENEVSRLNEQLDTLKDILSSKGVSNDKKGTSPSNRPKSLGLKRSPEAPWSVITRRLSSKSNHSQHSCRCKAYKCVACDYYMYHQGHKNPTATKPQNSVVSCGTQILESPSSKELTAPPKKGGQVKTNDGEERSNLHLAFTDLNREDEEDGVDDNFGHQRASSGRRKKMSETTPVRESNRSTPRGDNETPEGFKRLTRGRSMDSLNSQKTDGSSTPAEPVAPPRANRPSQSQGQDENEANRSDSIRNQSGRKYVRAAQHNTGLNKSMTNLSQSQNSLTRSNNNLSRVPSNKSLDNLSALGYKKSNENLSGPGTGIRGSLRRKLIGKRDAFAESATMRYKAVPSENLARLFLRGKSLTLQGPNEYVRGRIGLSGESPQEDINMEWVFGYRGKDCRNNLFVVSSGEICYFTAAVAVLYNTSELMQRHYTEHSSDIKSMAVHPDKITIATGQGSGMRESGLDNILPHVRVWNSINLETLIIIGEDVIIKGVSNLCFSKRDGGIHLCAIDESADHFLTVWNWKEDPDEPLVHEKTLIDPILVAEFHPNQDMIITCSKESLLFWTLVDDSYSSPYHQNGRFKGQGEEEDGDYTKENDNNSQPKITKRSATFDLAEKPKFVTSLAFLVDGSLITGDSNGTIILWDLDSCRVMHAVRKLMDGAISAISYNQTSNSFFVGCVTSPLLVEVDADFSELNRNNGIVDVVGGIRTIAFDLAGSIYIGTTKNCILTSEVERSDFTFATMGHNKELWGLCVDWHNQKFLTCGMDKLLIYWNKKQAEWYKEVDYCCMAAAFHPSYPLLAVGTDAGRWFAININSKDIVTMHADSKDQFNCIAFSPNGKRLAIGGQDSGIYIYRLDENENGSVRFSKVGKCIGHTSYITSIDWSSNSQLLRSNSGSHELLYWNVNYCKQYPADDVTSNMDWCTSTCTLDYSTVGIWPEGAQGNEINSVDVSPDQNVIALGEDSHLVKLYNYPCYVPKAQSKTALGHGSHVSRVRFLPDGKNFISTGGSDSTVILWNVETA